MADIKAAARAVRVPVIGANFLTLAEQAVKENHSHIRYLEALLAMESAPGNTRVVCSPDSLSQRRAKSRF